MHNKILNLKNYIQDLLTNYKNICAIIITFKHKNNNVISLQILLITKAQEKTNTTSIP